MQMQERIQAWFMGLPLKTRAIILGVLSVVALIYYAISNSDIEITLEDVLGWLPALGVLLALAGVGGFVAWRWWEQKQLERQMAINQTLAQQGVVRLALPSVEEKESAWKTINQQAMAFTTAIATVLRQSPNAHIALEVIGTEDGIYLQAWSPQELFQSVLQALIACFPAAQIREPKDLIRTPDALRDLDAGTKWVLLGLAQKAHYPLRAIGDFPSESLTFPLAVLTRTPGMGRIGFQLILKAPPARWSQAGMQEIQQQRAAQAQVKRAAAPMGEKERIEALWKKADAQTGVAATVMAFAEPKSADRLSRLVMGLTSMSQSRYNILRAVAQGQGAERITGRHFDHKAGPKTVLSADELAPLWHISLATEDVKPAPGILIPPPPSVIAVAQPGKIPYHPSYRIMGKGLMRNSDEVFVKWRHGFDTLVHSIWVGATGAGKSTLLTQMIMQDICAGYGAIVMEPHRDLTLRIIASVPPERRKDVIWINPTDPERSFGLNLMECPERGKEQVVAARFAAALKKVVNWDANTAARMDRLINEALMAILESDPHASIQNVLDFFRSDEYREQVIKTTKNQNIKDSWREFSEWGKSDRSSATGPVVNRLAPLLTFPMTMQVVAQSRTTLPLRELIDAGKIILIDLSKNDGRIGEKNSQILGVLMLATIWGSVSGRIKDSYNTPAYLWVDEFQEYVDETFISILAEARGFGLGLNMATQYYERIKSMGPAIKANCWTKVAGSIKSEDEARAMDGMFFVSPKQIMTMEKYTYLACTSANSQGTDTFTFKGMLPISLEKEKIEAGEAMHPAVLRNAFMTANGGRLPMPEDRGAKTFDFFAGVEPMYEAERIVWAGHRRELAEQEAEGMTPMEKIEARAAYLAGLQEDEWASYRELRRKADLEEYQQLLDDPTLVPDVLLTEKPEKEQEELGKFSERAVQRIKRIRRLSSLQIEIPRDEIVAERLRQRQAIEVAVTEFDTALLEL